MIKDMDKDALVAHMKASREIYSFDYGKESWRKAASLYKSATGMHFDQDCTGCRQRLLDWLLDEKLNK